MGVRFRDDVMTSLRLLTGTDRWVAIDLLAGIAGYVVWVAGSGALGLQVASLADYEVAPGGTPTTAVLGLVALLWLLLPAALGVARVRSRLLNIRNNIEQDYRLDRPAALLVPPTILVAILLVPLVLMEPVHPVVFVVLAPATLFLLVRTTAYSYRVYAFSHPVIPYASLFATLIAQAAVLLLYLGLTTENEGIVRGTIDQIGLPVDPLGATEVAGFTFPTALTAAVALPIVLVVAYLFVQTVAALVVRVRKPTVQPATTRTGQRYPPWLEVASNAGRSSSTTPSSSASSSNSSSSSGSTSSTGSSSAADPSGGTSAGTAGGANTGGTATADSTSTTSGSAASASESTGATGAAGGPGTDTADEDAESVSNTRVFTPPDGGDDDPLSPTTGDDGDPCPDCGATVPVDADRCPACGTDAS